MELDLGIPSYRCAIIILSVFFQVCPSYLLFCSSKQIPVFSVFRSSVTMASFKSFFLLFCLTPIFVASTTLPHAFDLQKRDLPTGTCNANTPCVNGACCGSDNLCGYSPKSCATGCQSNCKWDSLISLNHCMGRCTGTWLSNFLIRSLFALGKIWVKISSAKRMAWLALHIQFTL